MIKQRPIHTIGHSSRTGDELVELLEAHHVEAVVDVRSVPGSRRFPRFNREALKERLQAAGIAYVHEPALGGRRRRMAESRHTALDDPGLRAYADHMDTPEFAAGLTRLLKLADQRTTVVLCAEADPMRCHRQLIADALVARGRTVRHIVAADRCEPHRLSRDAVIEPGGTVAYRDPAPDQRRLF